MIVCHRNVSGQVRHVEAIDTLSPIHRVNVEQFHRLHDHRDPDRFGQRYRQIHALDQGLLSVTIEGVDVRVDVGELFGR